MKQMILLMLSLFLFVGCVAEEDPPPDFDTEAEPSLSTETDAETDAETEAETESETKAETAATVYRDGLSGEIADLTDLQRAEPTQTYYLTSVMREGQETAQLSPVGAIIFSGSDETDWYWYDARGAFSTRESLRADTVRYPRVYVDRCLYPMNEDLLAGQGGELLTADGIVELNSAGAWTGETADGKPYAVYDVPNTASERREAYGVYVGLSQTEAAYICLYTYTFDSEDYAQTVLFPLLERASAWTPAEGYFSVAKEMVSTTEEGKMRCFVTLALPESWLWNNSSVADDGPRMLGGRYATKRMELYGLRKGEWITEDGYLADKAVETERGTLDSGYAYILYRHQSASEGERIDVTWYYCEYMLAEDWRYMIAFLTFEDDAADYFDTVIRPAMNSVHFYIGSAE